MHILHTVLHNSKDADKENLINNQESLWLVIISIILVTLCVIQGGYCKEKLDASHSWGGGGRGKGFSISITVCWIMYGYHKETLHVNHL